MNEFDRKRYEATKELVIILGTLVVKHPTQRFGQLLRNYGFIQDGVMDSTGEMHHWANEFYTEPQLVLDRVKKALKELDGETVR